MSDAQYVAPNGDQIAAKIMDGEAVLINLSTGMYYSMADSATLIWSLIEQNRSMEDIVRNMVATYDVDAEQAREHLQQIVAELEQEGLVVVSSEGPEPAVEERPARAESDRLEYVAPRLEKFSDMAEMFALDPPLPGIIDRQS